LITVAIVRDLAHFEGPLDLLLALVRRNQYPLDALPIAEGSVAKIFQGPRCWG